MGIKSGKITATSSVWPVEDGGRVMLKLDAAAVGTSPSLGRRWIIAGLPLACWSRDHTITGDLACFNSFGFDCFVNTEQWVCAERALPSQSPVSLRATGKVKTGKISIDPADHPAHAAEILGWLGGLAGTRPRRCTGVRL